MDTQELVRPELFFWRTQAGAEVDLLIRDAQRVMPVEIKVGAAVDQRSIAGSRQCMKDLSLKCGWVIASGTGRRMLSPDIEVVPWKEIAAGEIDLF